MSPRSVLDSEFPSPSTPAHDRQGLARSGRWHSVWSMTAYWLFAANLHMCIQMHTHIHIPPCTDTCAHMRPHIHINIPSGYSPAAEAPHTRCQLPAQTLKLRNRKSRLKLRIVQSPGYQGQLVAFYLIYSLKWNNWRVIHKGRGFLFTKEDGSQRVLHPSKIIEGFFVAKKMILNSNLCFSSFMAVDSASMR